MVGDSARPRVSLVASDGVCLGVVAVDGVGRDDDNLILVDHAALTLAAVPLDDDDFFVAVPCALLRLVHDPSIAALAFATGGLPVVLVVAAVADDLLEDNLVAAVLASVRLQDDDDGIAASVVADDMAGMGLASLCGGDRDGRGDDGNGHVEGQKEVVGDGVLTAAEAPLEEQVTTTELGVVAGAGNVALRRWHNPSARAIEGAATVAATESCQSCPWDHIGEQILTCREHRRSRIRGRPPCNDQ